MLHSGSSGPACRGHQHQRHTTLFLVLSWFWPGSDWAVIKFCFDSAVTHFETLWYMKISVGRKFWWIDGSGSESHGTQVSAGFPGWNHFVAPPFQRKRYFPMCKCKSGVAARFIVKSCKWRSMNQSHFTLADFVSSAVKQSASVISRRNILDRNIDCMETSAPTFSLSRWQLCTTRYRRANQEAERENFLPE